MKNGTIWEDSRPNKVAGQQERSEQPEDVLSATNLELSFGLSQANWGGRFSDLQVIPPLLRSTGLVQNALAF